MEFNENSAKVQSIISAIEELLPQYVKEDEDYNKSQGNVAVCIIDKNGNEWGKIFGSNKIRSRESFRVAWIKASQVWITNMKTGEYEKLVFNNEIDDHTFGISKPDLIGWEGGQPVTLKDGTRLSIGFSGFRGVSDLEIVLKAIEKAKL